MQLAIVPADTQGACIHMYTAFAAVLGLPNGLNNVKAMFFLDEITVKQRCLTWRLGLVINASGQGQQVIAVS